MRCTECLLLLIVVHLCCEQTVWSQNQAASTGGKRADKTMVQIGIGPKGPIMMKRPPVRSGPTKLDLPEKNNSLWNRYYEAGEDAIVTRHDPTLAKQYYMASLAELEKHPQTKGSDMFLSVRLSALESGLENAYPSDWSKQRGKSEDVMKQRKEQVDVYSRIARINEYYAPPDDLLRIKAKERYVTVRQAYEKALAATKSSTQTESSKTESSDLKESASK